MHVCMHTYFIHVLTLATCRATGCATRLYQQEKKLPMILLNFLERWITYCTDKESFIYMYIFVKNLVVPSFAVSNANTVSRLNDFLFIDTRTLGRGDTAILVIKKFTVRALTSWDAFLVTLDITRQISTRSGAGQPTLHEYFSSIFTLPSYIETTSRFKWIDRNQLMWSWKA